MADAAQNLVQEKIIVTNKHGGKLVDLLEDPIMMNLAVALEYEGISSFRFDFSGNGENEGIFEYGNYRKETDDLHFVVEHFSGTSRVASVILGHSKGVMKGIAERLGKDFMEMIKEGFLDIQNNTGGVAFRVTEESLMDRLSTDMHEACLQIGKECHYAIYCTYRVLTVHGSDDEVIPVDDSVEFSKMIPNHKLSAVLLIISVKGSWPLLCCLDFSGLYYTVHPSIAMTHAWLAARTVVMDGEYWIRIWQTLPYPDQEGTHEGVHGGGSSWFLYPTKVGSQHEERLKMLKAFQIAFRVFNHSNVSEFNIRDYQVPRQVIPHATSLFESSLVFRE
ncbi:hypothetical protein ACLB2K_071700 [Fragaria x ananassa]